MGVVFILYLQNTHIYVCFYTYLQEFVIYKYQNNLVSYDLVWQKNGIFGKFNFDGKRNKKNYERTT